MTWFIALDGHEFDLEDGKDCLCVPFDPSVHVVELLNTSTGTTQTYLLHSSDFAPCTEASEVHEIAIPLIRRLNALVAIMRNGRPVRLGAVIRQRDDGKYERTVFAELSGVIGPIRFRATGTLSGGKPATPKPSLAQRGLRTQHAQLIAALEHYSRADNWYDLYKAYEAVKKHIGSKSKIRAEFGVSKTDLDNFTLSSEIARHHLPSAPPKRVLTLKEGRLFVASLLRDCLD